MLHRYTRNLPVLLVRALARPRLAAGVLVSMAMLTTACSNDIATDVTSPASGLEVSLGKNVASGFAVLANGTVTCTDGTITGGNVGTQQATPTGAFVQTRCPITGTINLGNGAAKAAYKGFLSNYADVAKTSCKGAPLTGTLAGVILAPGVYCFDAGATLTGVLTLNGPAKGVWTFKIGTLGSGALTGSSFTVVMAGNGQACNVTWWVANGSTMTDSNLKGTVLSGAGITFTNGTYNGNAFAKADATITGTAVTGCA